MSFSRQSKSAYANSLCIPLTKFLRKRTLAGWLLVFLVFLPLESSAREETESSESPIDFANVILPILSDNCFHCHGPDEQTREADLRLDTREGLLGWISEDGGEPSGGVVVAGDPDASELYLRIVDTDEYYRMPPPSSHREVSAPEIELIRQWILQGATWSQHWSFAEIANPSIPSPDIHHDTVVHNPIDLFVLQQLQERELQQTAPASRERLIRRVTLDLTGLPPTLEEIDRFLADDRLDAYDRLVDRLLASPRYGERMAWDWLDVARYADTNGYQGDNERTMWPWRDWVIQVLNDDLPFDSFSRQQIAGDLIPQATHEEILATGFLRNHMINGEGGRIAEENRVEYVFDQAETVATVWLGLTYQCCRCHDHKYDPISQEDYYELFAIFNQTPIDGSGGNPHTPPILETRPDSIRFPMDRLKSQLANVENKIQAIASHSIENEEEKRRELQQQLVDDGWRIVKPTSWKSEQNELHWNRDYTLKASSNPDNDVYTITFDHISDPIHGIQIEALPDPSHVSGGLSHAGSSNFVLTDFTLKAVSENGSDPTEIKIESAVATFEQNGLPIEAAFDDDPLQSGWAVYQGDPVIRPQAAFFRFSNPLQIPKDTQLEVQLAFRSQHAKHVIGRLRVSFATKPNLALAPDDTQTLAAMLNAEEHHDRDENEWQQANELARRLIVDRELADNGEYQSLVTKQADLKSEITRLQRLLPRVMVMADQEDLRPTYVLDRGLYSEHRGQVIAELPPIELASESEQSQSTSSPSNRLDLAEWLFDRRHPLTARVTVNREWKKFFGAGLVRTPEDFGSQGDRPTHPQLLDWLATELVRNDWDLKQLQRLIVTSATYRQSAAASEKSREFDTDNRWLSRGPRRRMPSWMIRDAALFQSGLLVDQVGGEPVKPYQPSGVWAEATFGNTTYQQDHGEKLYRRSIYTFWRRIVGPTMFFDVSKRQTCSVDTPLTNTPLHALVTLNDITFVEAARVMAQELLVDDRSNVQEKLTLAFRKATSRFPTEEEEKLLAKNWEKMLEFYTTRKEDAHQLIAQGEAPIAPNLADEELAALTSVCMMLLNLDEAISR